VAEQLGLFAPRRAVAPAGCPRVPGPLCRDGREGRRPGRERCEELGEQEAERIRLLEALAPEELATPCGADLGVEEFGTGQYPPAPAPQRETMGSANARRACLDCGESGAGLYVTRDGRNVRVCGQCLDHWAEWQLREREPLECELQRTSLFHPTMQEAAAAALSKACGACGSTTGAVFYERGPLAGLRRCWPCARPVLTTMEVHDG